MSEQQPFERTTTRKPFTKPFTYFREDIAGASNKDILDKYPKFKDASAAMNSCMMYANSYSTVMLNRALVEDPDMLENKGVTKEEFLAHM